MTALLSLIGVTKRYARGLREVEVLRDVLLELGSGDFACVLGGKGSGKTTLLEVASGYQSADSGEVRFQGKDLGRASARAKTRYRRSEVACVWNRSVPVLMDDVIGHVGYPLTSNGASVKEARRAASAMIERVGAREYADAKVAELSEGQRMRVALAQACVRSPRLLIADELTDTLDMVERMAVLGLLQGFASEGVGILMTAADAHGAIGSNWLLSLSGGRLIEAEAPAGAPAPADPAEVVPLRGRSRGGEAGR